MLEPSYQFRKVAVSIQVALPTSFDPETELIPTSIINPDSLIAIGDIADEIDASSVEAMRTTWLQALDSEREDLVARQTNKELAKENPVAAVLREIVKGSDKAIMGAWVRAAKLPVPDNYTLLLPNTDADARRSIIEDLVPFKETRSMLSRLEASFKLPMRIVQIAHTATEMRPRSVLN